jgi:hypothetical protein
VDQATAQALAEGYLAYTTTGDRSVLARFSADFYDDDAALLDSLRA